MFMTPFRIVARIALIASLATATAMAQSPASRTAERPVVHEITMAAPDIVRVEVREAPVIRGRIVPLSAPSNAPNGSWIEADGGLRGIVIGPRRDHVRTADTTNAAPLSRPTVDDAARYGPLGPRRVSAVYRKSVPWSSGVAHGGTPIVSFKHFVHIRLDGPLPPGRHTIRWPADVLPPTDFDFDPKATRSSSIRATQLGHRADDPAKSAYLALWLPGGPDDGAVDFRAYGLDRFQVIDDRGTEVFSGPIVLRVGPRDKEPGSGVKGDILTYTRPDGTTYEANRAGTYVFGLDYSAWRGASPGHYCLRVPGLGVSDPFEIGDDVWHQAARTSMAGLYHQRSGMALDGRFGYRRPEGFTESSGIVVRQSRLPLAFSREGGDQGLVEFSDAVKPPWITDETVPDAWGGYHDAGDWDRRIVHLHATSLLLDVFDQLPPASRAMAFGLPPSSEVLNHPLYRGKDFPDLVDEAIWNLDFYRRLQRPDGAVRGGIESARTPRRLEPSWLESQTVFAYAPDPISTFTYAAGAAKAAIVLGGLGEAALADLFRDSAIRAWSWADRASAEPAHGYGEIRQLIRLDDVTYDRQLAPILDRTRDLRAWAAAALFRLTGEERFNAVAREALKGRPRLGTMDAAWDYALAQWPDTDPSVQDKARRDIVALARDDIARPQQGPISYRTMKHRYAPIGWGEGLAPAHLEAAALIRAHRITGDDAFVRAMLDGSAHILGANQIGMSFTVGLGRRWPVAPLHEDSRAAAVDPPAGITIYGWALPSRVAAQYGWVFGPKWAALSGEVPTRRVEPPLASLPLYEALIEYPYVSMSAEYTVHQTIATTAAVWSYLQGRGRCGGYC